VAATLSWDVSHAEGRLTESIRSAFTGAIYEFATHRLQLRHVLTAPHVLVGRGARTSVISCSPALIGCSGPEGLPLTCCSTNETNSTYESRLSYQLPGKMAD
jgi:hypothetical protein